MDTKKPKPPVIRQVTDGWHTLYNNQDSLAEGTGILGRVCEHYVSFDAPMPVSVAKRDGTMETAGPGPVRSFIGLIIEVGDAQLQVRGRLNLGDDRVVVEVDA